jgi:hypothetical protein
MITIAVSLQFHLPLNPIGNRWLFGLMIRQKQVAHFLLIPELAGSPQNEALIGAYLDLLPRCIRAIQASTNAF